MKIFLDTANIEEIKKYGHMIDGVTTNPTLIAKLHSNSSFEEIIDGIQKIVDGPISVEVISQTAKEMFREAKTLSEISPNIVVKIPMTEEGLKATKELSKLGVKTNVTLIFSPNQAILAAKCGATYASIFIGRLDDLGHDGIQVVKDTADIFQSQNFATEIITASVRNPMHVINAAKAGTHVITIPPSILSLMIKHMLTDAGLETFMKDWAGFMSTK
jgi:transaldolase